MPDPKPLGFQHLSRAEQRRFLLRFGSLSLITTALISACGNPPAPTVTPDEVVPPTPGSTRIVDKSTATAALPPPTATGPTWVIATATPPPKETILNETPYLLDKTLAGKIPGMGGGNYDNLSVGGDSPQKEPTPIPNANGGFLDYVGKTWELDANTVGQKIQQQDPLTALKLLTAFPQFAGWDGKTVNVGKTWPKFKELNELRLFRFKTNPNIFPSNPSEPNSKADIILDTAYGKTVLKPETDITVVGVHGNEIVVTYNDYFQRTVPKLSFAILTRDQLQGLFKDKKAAYLQGDKTKKDAIKFTDVTETYSWNVNTIDDILFAQIQSELKPKETFNLIPAQITPEMAKKYIVGSEYSDLKQFDGRVFTDSSGATIILSQKAAVTLGDKITPEQLLKSSWGEALVKNIKAVDLNKDNVLFLMAEGEVFVALNENNQINKSLHPNRHTLGLYLTKEGAVKIDRQGIIPVGTPLQLYEKGGISQIVFTDGYQIIASYESNKREWVKILPHERRDGRAELLTNEQRIKQMMKDLKNKTGYDGGGEWNKQTGISKDGAYEIIFDKAGNPQQLIIRKSNSTDVVGLNESQAILVRQAWKILEQADPEIYKKFWRINKVGGVGLTVNPGIIVSTHWNLGNYGLIMPKRLAELNDAIRTVLVEGYELYSVQFGLDEGGYLIIKPPDCFDTYYGMDAARRAKAWLQKYGNTPIFDQAKNDIDGIIYNSATTTLSRPCNPQIPFEP